MDGTLGFKGVSNWDRGAGGGSGGSVWIDTPLFAGSGSVQTNGGLANNGMKSATANFANDILYAGGSGGGGRIAIYCTTRDYKGTLSSKGGGLRVSAKSSAVVNYLIYQGNCFLVSCFSFLFFLQNNYLHYFSIFYSFFFFFFFFFFFLHFFKFFCSAHFFQLY